MRDTHANGHTEATQSPSEDASREGLVRHATRQLRMSGCALAGRWHLLIPKPQRSRMSMSWFNLPPDNSVGRDVPWQGGGNLDKSLAINTRHQRSLDTSWQEEWQLANRTANTQASGR